MYLQTPARHRAVSLVGVCLWLMTISVSAQDAPAPEFLYRDGNRLILLNGYTGEQTTLPLEVSNQDRFSWSPDGRYLISQIWNPDLPTLSLCLNLYDVDLRQWLYEEPIACATGLSAFFNDSNRLLYSTTNEYNEVLWLFRVDANTHQELYRTTNGSEIRSAGIKNLRLSPTEHYLSFVDYTEIMGGAINEFVVMNTAEQDYVTISAPDTYYAHYTPIWSPNDDWFLIVMQEDYVTSGALASTNHQGDLYLVNPETGEMFRITYTPAGFETDIRWTADGEIAFRTVTMIEDNFSFTTEEAMSIETIPDSEIVQPEPITAEDFSLRRGGVPGMVSPDPNLTAWIGSFNQISAEGGFVELKIGFWIDQAPIINVTISIPATSTYERVIIGWRPTDYPYPEG